MAQEDGPYAKNLCYRPYFHAEKDIRYLYPLRSFLRFDFGGCQRAYTAPYIKELLKVVEKNNKSQPTEKLNQAKEATKMGKASKNPAKATSASNKSSAAPTETSAEPTTQGRRSKRALDPATPPQENPFFYVAVCMVIFAFVLLFQLSDKLYERYFGGGKDSSEL